MEPKAAVSKSLRSILSEITFIEEEAWQDFAQHHIEKKLNKGDFLLKEGQTCRHLYFLKKGLIRSFNFEQDKEVTFNFYDGPDLFYDDHSFLSQKPCGKSYQVLEESELTLIPRAHLLSMFDKYKCFERIGRISIERAHIKMIEDRDRLLQHSAEYCYRYLLDHSPRLIQALPQKIIASYLQITTEHLSRIRSKMKKG